MPNENLEEVTMDESVDVVSTVAKGTELGVIKALKHSSKEIIIGAAIVVGLYIVIKVGVAKIKKLCNKKTMSEPLSSPCDADKEDEDEYEDEEE